MKTNKITEEEYSRIVFETVNKCNDIFIENGSLNIMISVVFVLLGHALQTVKNDSPERYKNTRKFLDGIIKIADEKEVEK